MGGCHSGDAKDNASFTITPRVYMKFINSIITNVNDTIKS